VLLEGCSKVLSFDDRSVGVVLGVGAVSTDISRTKLLDVRKGARDGSEERGDSVRHCDGVWWFGMPENRSRSLEATGNLGGRCLNPQTRMIGRKRQNDAMCPGLWVRGGAEFKLHFNKPSEL
jgi:hypothetical protein